MSEEKFVLPPPTRPNVRGQKGFKRVLGEIIASRPNVNERGERQTRIDISTINCALCSRNLAISVTRHFVTQTGGLVSVSELVARQPGARFISQHLGLCADDATHSNIKRFTYTKSFVGALPK